MKASTNAKNKAIKLKRFIIKLQFRFCYLVKNLKKLNLSNNNIKIIPKEIIELRNLELLDLSGNSINNFFSKLCSLKKLQVLNLNNNKIKSIPRQINNLGNLKNLQIANNKISKLPEEIKYLTSLQKINLSKNSITNFPTEILELKELKSIWLNGLELQNFPVIEIVEFLTNLKSIYCFGKLHSTKAVDIYYEQLTKQKGNTYPDLIFLANTLKINKQPLKKLATAKSTIDKKNVFISYSHKDKKWLEKIQTNLKVLHFNNFDFDIWDDTRIKAGNEWKEQIKIALEKAGIAILIVSTDFLASEFIRSDELPTILKNSKEEGTKILPLIVGHCRFTKDKKLSNFQSVNDPSYPLSSLSDADVEKELVNLAEEVAEILEM